MIDHRNHVIEHRFKEYIHSNRIPLGPMKYSYVIEHKIVLIEHPMVSTLKHIEWCMNTLINLGNTLSARIHKHIIWAKWYTYSSTVTHDWLNQYIFKYLQDYDRTHTNLINNATHLTKLVRKQVYYQRKSTFSQKFLLDTYKSLTIYFWQIVFSTDLAT